MFPNLLTNLQRFVVDVVTLAFFIGTIAVWLFTRKARVEREVIDKKNQLVIDLALSLLFYIIALAINIKIGVKSDVVGISFLFGFFTLTRVGLYFITKED